MAIGAGRLGFGQAAQSPAVARAHSAKLANLQILRAAAAGSVLLSHAARWLASSRSDGRLAAIFNDHLGSFGVALFFAISGFLMARLARASDPGTFLAHRFLRIYPAFLLAVAAWLATQYLASWAPRLDPWTLTLAPVGVHSYPIGIEWTLVYETSFYVAVAGVAALGLARRIEWIAVGWIGLIASLALAGSPLASVEPLPLASSVLLKDADVPFAAGLLIPSLVERRLLPARLCLLGIPAAAIVIWGEFEPLRWVLAGPAVLIVAALVQVRPMRAGLAGSALLRLGDWSYALYLVHMPVLIVAERLAPREVPAISLFASVVAIALAAAACLGTVDVALYRHLRSHVDRGSARSRAMLAAAFTAIYLGAAITALGVAARDAWESARARAGLAVLPTAALSTPADLGKAIAAAGLGAPASLVGGIERLQPQPDGQVLVVGWGVDGARPAATIHMALFCDGALATLGRPQRYRPDVSARLGRPDLARVRIGFTLALLPGACRAGASILPVLIDPDGRLAAGSVAATEP